MPKSGNKTTIKNHAIATPTGLLTEINLNPNRITITAWIRGTQIKENPKIELSRKFNMLI
jgi:hypothetical protein